MSQPESSDERCQELTCHTRLWRARGTGRFGCSQMLTVVARSVPTVIQHYSREPDIIGLLNSGLKPSEWGAASAPFVWGHPTALRTEKVREGRVSDHGGSSRSPIREHPCQPAHRSRWTALEATHLIRATLRGVVRSELGFRPRQPCPRILPRPPALSSKT